MPHILDQVPGFGACGTCTFNTSGWASLCYKCARRVMEDLRPSHERCEICDLPFHTGETVCRNWLCHHRDRQFEWNYAITMRSGAMEHAINRHKVVGHNWGWSLILGRVLAGFLEDRQNRDLFRSFDLIVASPTY